MTEEVCTLCQGVEEVEVILFDGGGGQSAEQCPRCLAKAFEEKVRRLQGESDAFKLRLCSMEITLSCLVENGAITVIPTEKYDALVADAKGLVEALKVRSDTHDAECVVVRNVNGHDLKCTCSRAEALDALAEHDALTEQTEEKPCSMTPESLPT